MNDIGGTKQESGDGKTPRSQVTHRSGSINSLSVSHTPFQAVTIARLDTDRSHAITGEAARVYFQLSGPPPLGWSYIFTTIWQTTAYPAKGQAGVENDALWIDCVPEEVVKHHFGRLTAAVQQANQQYGQKAQQQAFQEGQQAQADTVLRAKLEAVSRTLYPAPNLSESRCEPGSFFGRMFRGRLKR